MLSRTDNMPELGRKEKENQRTSRDIIHDNLVIKETRQKKL